MENNMPLVSVIMPSYNSEKYIKESVESILKQSYKNWELYVIDDCSTDGTLKVLREFYKKYSNIHILRLKKNSGPDAARTKGIEMSLGKYIAFIDSDDLWTPDKLYKQISFMETQRILFCCTAYDQIDEQGNSLGISFCPSFKVNYNKALLHGNPIGNLSVVYNQEVLGKFRVPSIKKRNDFALWLKILKHTEYCYGMREILAHYRVHNNSISSNKVTILKYHWILYRKVESLSLLKSVFYIFSLLFFKFNNKLKSF